MSSLFDSAILQAPVFESTYSSCFILSSWPGAQAFGTAFLFRRVFGQVDL